MSKVAKTLLTSFISILVLSGIAIVIILYLPGEKDETGAETIDDIVEYSYETPEITTDLADGSFVRIQFQIVTDGKEAKDEVSKRELQIKNILIKELDKMDKEKIKSGLEELENNIKEKLNEVMTETKINNVYTISKILQ